MQLKAQGTIEVASVATYGRASLATLDALEVDGHIIKRPLVLIDDLRQLRAGNPYIRGILGQDFLGHFDLFIDYSRKILCLDETRRLQQGLSGEHVALVESQDPASDMSLPGLPLVWARLFDTRERKVLLRLDSGAPTGQCCMDAVRKLRLGLLKRAELSSHVVGVAKQPFALLLPQNIRLGTRSNYDVSFAIPLNARSG